MRVLFRAVLAALLALTLSAGSVAAVNDSPQTAQPVSAESGTQGGTLIGTTGGAFRFYRFNYPGGNVPVRIHLSWAPGFHITGPAFGFNVYGPNGLAGSGVRGDDADSNTSTMNLDLAAPAPGEYLVQVYNYTDGSQQGYSLVFSGLGPAPKVVTDNVTPERAVEVSATKTNLSGSLTGRASGAFNFFNLEYPGGEWPMKVSLSFSPAGSLSAEAFGFNVYKNDELVATGGEVARDGDTATKTATVTDVAPGMYGLQVYNYAEGVTGSYVVGVDGLTGATAIVSGNTSADRAFGLSPRVQGARGTIVGNSGGSFAYFGLNYQGNDEKITVSMGFKPGRNVTGQGVGVNLYRGADLVATSTFTDGRTLAEGVAFFSYSSDQAGLYVIQAYNYIEGVTADYSLYALGLK